MVRHDPEGHELRALLALAPPLARTRVLEIGAGDGRLTRRYAHLVESVVAVDPDASAMAALAADPPPGVDVRMSGFEAVALGDYTFDLVLFAWSL